MTSNRYRTIWVSDFHLGAKGCRADEIVAFLTENSCDTLYLVGDILDLWALRRKPRFPQAHLDVITTLLTLATRNTEIIYLPGNHDAEARQLAPMRLGNLTIVDKAIHLTALGLPMLVLHGDQFDPVSRSGRWLAMAGDVGYAWLQRCNVAVNALRGRLGLPYWSLSAWVKHRIKRAVQFMGDYQSAIIQAARAHNAHGVVCGHIHHAELWRLDGIVYANTGDWVESRTALVEEHDGTLRIVRHENPATTPQPEPVRTQIAGLSPV